MSENNILGVILAGGKSKRFGNDKTIVKLGNKTLLDHTIEKIEKNFNEILIVSNSEKIDIKKIYKDVDKNVLKILNVKNSMNSKKSYGGTSERNIKNMIRKFSKWCLIPLNILRVQHHTKNVLNS